MKRTVLWLLVLMTAGVILLSMVGARRKVDPSPVTTAPASPGEKQEVVAALPTRPLAEGPVTPIPTVPRRWRVLFHSPTLGHTGVSRGSAIELFFNGPVEREVVEWAFSISPFVRGTFRWQGSDHLIFAPNNALRPATEYTVSLSPVDGSREKEPYELLGARWSFITGQARTYGRDIQPLVGAYCGTCHGSNGSAAGVPLGTYRDVSRYVVLGRSKESRLYTFVQDRRHHIKMAGPNHSTRDMLAILKDWIDEDGAVE